MKRLLLMAVTVTAAFVGTAALACRVALTPERVVAGADDVVVVTVVSGEAVGGVREWQSWRARGRLVRVVAGAPGRTAFSFDNSGESASCDLAFPVPKPGERWVLYLSRRGAGGWSRPRSYPVAFMRPHDRRLAPTGGRR